METQEIREVEEKNRLERKINKLYEKMIDLDEQFRFIRTEKEIKELEYEIKNKQEKLFEIKASRYNSYERKEKEMDYFNERY